MIAPEDLKLLRLTDSKDEALRWILEAFAAEEEARVEALTSPRGPEAEVAKQEKKKQSLADDEKAELP
jgi:hypothetical protein